MNKKNLAGAAVAALAAAAAASAAETHRCASLFDDAQRLACYDGTYGKPVRPAGNTAPATPATVIATPAVPVPARPPAAAIQPAPPSVAPAPAPKPAAKAKDEPVSGRIVAVGRLPNDRFSVTLDNGQLWMQLERDLSAEVRVGDTVQVRPAMLGSWMLETKGGVKTRVRLAR